MTTCSIKHLLQRVKIVLTCVDKSLSLVGPLRAVEKLLAVWYELEHHWSVYLVVLLLVMCSNPITKENKACIGGEGRENQPSCCG